MIVHWPDAESTAAAVRYLVARLGAELAEHHERLDLLVNNAGIAGPERRTLTGQGDEPCFTAPVPFAARS